MNAGELLLHLPAYRNKWERVTGKQSIRDIRELLLDCHEEFASQYDAIVYRFGGGGDLDILKELFHFLKTNVRYQEEDEHAQTIKTPSAILETGVCDCKGFASFVGGVIDALNRIGYSISWRYCFARYPDTNHVFVEADVDGLSYWVDPVVGAFDQRTPAPKSIRKFERDMALYKVSGVRDTSSNSVGCGCDSMGKLSQAAQDDQCFQPIETFDQQVARLTACNNSGSGSVEIPGSDVPPIYDLPQGGDIPMTAPIDATFIDPGEPATMNPPPASGTGNGNGAGGGDGSKKWLWWLGAAALLYALSRKR